MALSVAQCREILGIEEEGKTYEQIERVRDSIAVLANGLYDQIFADWKKDPEAVRWFGYAQEHPEEVGTCEQ
jgi:hypothetical protein